MNRMRGLIRIVAVAALALPIACQGTDGGCALFGGGHSVEPKDAPPFNLGLEVWKHLRDRSSRDPARGQEKVAVWDSHKSEFIDAVNIVFPPEQAAGLPAGVKSLFPLVDDGTLPKTTEAVAAIIERLYQDPERKALKELWQRRKHQKRILDRDAWIALWNQLFSQPELADFVAVLGELVHAHDGVDDMGQPNGEKKLLREFCEFLSARVAEVQVGESSAWIDAMLVEKDLPSSINLGKPAWVVRLDPLNNPRVAIDPATGKLYFPFVDKNGDGLADANAAGDPVNSSGQLIQIPAFGVGGARAIAPDGNPLFVYYDAKRTGLGILLMFLGDLLKHGVHLDLRPVLEAVLGPRILYDNATPSNPADDYERFDPNINPLLDLHWALQSEELKPLLADLGGGQETLLPLGKILKAFQDVGFLQDPAGWHALLDLIEGFQPILDAILEKPTGSSPSTAELLLNLPGQLQPGTAQKLALMMQYRNLVIASGQLDISQSVPVDYGLPMVAGGQDNRSVFERTIALVVSLDGPAIPLVGKSLAELAIQGMAKGNGNGGLIEFLSTAGDIPLLGALAVPALNLLGYDGQKVWANLQVLDSLQAMGATAGASEVLKVFVDQKQTKLILAIFHELDQDLARDLDASPSTVSVIRRSEPSLIAILMSAIPGQLAPLFQGLPTSAAALETLVDDDAPIQYRDGSPAPSRLHRLTVPLRAIVHRADAAGEYAKLDHLLKTTANLLAETTVDPATGKEILVRPGMTALVSALGSGGEPGKFKALVTSRHLPILLELWKTIDLAPQRDGFYAALRAFLVPHPESPNLELFGAALRVVAQSLEREGVKLPHFSAYLSEVLDPDHGWILDIVSGLGSMAQTGFMQSLRQALQNLFWPGPDGSGIPPIETFLQIVEELEGPEPTPTQEDLEKTLKEAVSFIRDDSQHGLPRIYMLILGRKK